MQNKSLKINEIVGEVSLGLRSLGVFCKKLCDVLGYENPKEFLDSNNIYNSEYIKDEYSDEIKMLIYSIRYHDDVLNMAAGKGYVNIARLLIELGCDVNKADVFGNTPLHYAVLNKRKEMLKLLLYKGANPNVANNIKATPLIIAAKMGSTYSVLLLLKSGADPNTKCDEDMSALYMAVKEEKEDVVRLLVANERTDPNIPDSEGVTPLEMSVKEGREDIMIELLANKKTDPNIPSSKGVSILREMIRTEDFKFVPDLISAGARFNVEDITFRLLSWLVASSETDALDVIFKSGVNINMQNLRAKTLIDIAKSMNLSYMVSFLVKRGATEYDGSHALASSNMPISSIVEAVISCMPDIQVLDAPQSSIRK